VKIGNPRKYHTDYMGLYGIIQVVNVLRTRKLVAPMTDEHDDDDIILIIIRVSDIFRSIYG